MEKKCKNCGRENCKIAVGLCPGCYTRNRPERTAECPKCKKVHTSRHLRKDGLCLSCRWLEKPKQTKVCSVCAEEKTSRGWYGKTCNTCKMRNYRASRGEQYTQTRKAFNRKPEQRFKATMRSARARGLEWTISQEQFFQTIEQPCYYCETPFHQICGGLDRIDNTQPYHLANVLPCCQGCNYLRADLLTVEETKALVKVLQSLRGTSDIWNNLKSNKKEAA